MKLYKKYTNFTGLFSIRAIKALYLNEEARFYEIEEIISGHLNSEDINDTPLREPLLKVCKKS